MQNNKLYEDIFNGLKNCYSYLLPYSSGEYMIYHYFGNNKVDDYYYIHKPRYFWIKLYYNNNLFILKDLVKYPPAKPYSYYAFEAKGTYSFEISINLEDYFTMSLYKDMLIPVALDREKLHKKIDRIKKLIIFS